MRVMSVVKVALLAATVALPASFSAASAKGMKPPPGACAFEKKWIATGTLCSYQCNPATQWCSQQLCTNGALTPMLPCYGSFCAAKCGG
jgi:hypothetical protein